MSLVIVDERDPSLVQTAGVPDRFGDRLEYNSGCLGWQAGGTWAFSWNGGDIALYGSVVFQGRGNATFSVDSGNAQAYTAPIEDLTRRAHYKFFETSGLTEGVHQIVVTQGSNDRESTMFYDYILYRTGSATRITIDTRYFIDDSDIMFTESGWTPLQAQFNSFKETLTRAADGSVFTYKFFGTGISVFGGLDPTTATQYQASIAIDGAVATDYNEASTVRAEDWGQYNRQFVSIDGLEQGVEHTLTFTARSPGLLIDYLLVSPGEGGSRSADSALSVSASGSATGTASSMPTATTTSTESDSKSSNVGAIAGGAAGGGVFLIILAVLLFFLRKRSRKNNARKSVDLIDGEEPKPFVLGAAPGEGSARSPGGAGAQSWSTAGALYTETNALAASSPVPGNTPWNQTDPQPWSSVPLTAASSTALLSSAAGSSSAGAQSRPGPGFYPSEKSRANLAAASPSVGPLVDDNVGSSTQAAASPRPLPAPSSSGLQRSGTTRSEAPPAYS